MGTTFVNKVQYVGVIQVLRNAVGVEGVFDFPEKNALQRCTVQHYEGWVGVAFPEKKHYVLHLNGPLVI